MASCPNFDGSRASHFMYEYFVQSLNGVRHFATPWTAACQVSLSFTISQSLLKLMAIDSVTPSIHLMLCCLLLLLPSVFPSIRVFSSESALHIRWPKYWSFCFSIRVDLGLTGLIFFLSNGTQESSPTPQFESINYSALRLPYVPTLTSVRDY